jgi:hypothetical protein
VGIRRPGTATGGGDGENGQRQCLPDISGVHCVANDVAIVSGFTVEV